MAIIIKNTGTVKTKAEELAANSNKIYSVKHSIEYILTEIRQYWEQSQQDAQVFSKGLESSIEFLDTVISCNKDFATAINDYMNTTEKTSSTTV